MNRKLIEKYKRLRQEEQFYQKIQPYIEQGILREVCNTKDFSIVSVGERAYAACPYVLLSDEAYGIFMSPGIMKKIVSDSDNIYPLMKNIFDDIKTNKNLLFDFREESIDFLKQWIKDAAHVDLIDYDLEEELHQMNNINKKRRD